MKIIGTPAQRSLMIGVGILLATACETKTDLGIKQMDPAQTAAIAKNIEATVTPQIDSGLTLRLWGIDSLVADPVSIDIDDLGRLYYTRTNRQKNSEFDIRGHQDWEIESIALQTIEEKRAFLRKTLSPENSRKNLWLGDVNGDGLHDWRDMTIEKENVYMLKDVSGDGVADLSQLVIEDFHDEVTDAAGGVMKHGEDLFVGIGPDLWRVKDKNNDGKADEKESISHGYGIHIGFSGHGMSGIEIGPEGKIYWQIGDIGFNGVDKSGQKWEYPNSGVVVRSNPDGSDFEVFAYGNRNTHEFVFDEYGNMISEDNDGDHAGESERLVYIVNGADIGWRSNWQYGKYRDPDNNTYKVWMDEKMYVPRFEGQPAYITPTIRNFVNGPTGMLYNPGTALSAAWKNTFFIVEFVGNPSRSGIHAFKLNPKGASFELGEYKKVLGGVLATGIDFGPDGALYLSDWIDGWDTKNYGRVWKLDAKDADANERKETQNRLAQDIRDTSEKDLGEWLRHKDMRVRQKAQFELATREKDGLEVFQQALAQKQHQLARVHAIWGISQFARKDAKHGEILMPFLNDEDAEIRAQAARWLGDVRCKEAGESLIPLLNDANSRARFFAAEALGRIGYESAVSAIINLLRSNNDEDNYIRHAASLALARIGKAEPIVALSSDPSRAVRIGAVLALRRMRHEGIAAFLKDADEFVVTEAARAIHDDLSIEAALPALGDLLNTSKFSNEALVRREISANLRVGTEKSMQNLIDYAAKDGGPLPMRVEAIAALSTWAKPSVLDRVDGRFRGAVTRDATSVKAKSRSTLSQLAGHREGVVRVAAIKAIGKLQLPDLGPLLFAKLKADPLPEVRIQALRSLTSLDNEKTDEVIGQALSDKDKSVRVAGLDQLGKLDIPDELKVVLLRQVVYTRTTDEKQAALTALGSMPAAYTEKVFNDFLSQMASGKLPKEVHLDLAEAIDSTKSADLIGRFRKISSDAGQDSVSALFETALFGGNEERGRRIFYRNQSAQCIRCHAYDDYGGNAGPRLNGVARRLTRMELLESLVNPDARLAAGFGTVKLELKNGKSINGILQSENKNQFVVKIGDKSDTTVRSSDVIKRTNAPSSMPAMRYVLSKREIRDVVSFLATLTQDN